MAKRNLDVDGYQDEEGYFHLDRDQVIQTVADLICGIDHIGGIVTVAPKRRQAPGTDQYMTVGWSILVDSFSPPVMTPKAEVAPEPDPEPVPEPVGA